MTSSTNTATNTTNIYSHELENDYIRNECDEGIKLYWYKQHYENYYNDISASNAVFHGSALDKMEVLDD